MGTNRVEKKLRVAFRPVDGEEYENIWPKRDLREFKISY